MPLGAAGQFDDHLIGLLSRELLQAGGVSQGKLLIAQAETRTVSARTQCQPGYLDTGGRPVAWPFLLGCLGRLGAGRAGVDAADEEIHEENLQRESDEHVQFRIIHRESRRYLDEGPGRAADLAGRNR